MVSRYRRLAESLKQKFRIAPSSTRFKPATSSRNERMLEELGAFSLQFRKMQALVDVQRQAIGKTCARSRGFINAKAPKQYTNGPVGSSVMSVSQDLSYDSNAVDIMSTLSEQLDEKLHVEITLPIEKWLGELKDTQKQMATLDRARLDADTCKREVEKLEAKIAHNTGTHSASRRPTLRVPAANGPDASAPATPPAAPDSPPPAWNQSQAEQAAQRLSRKRTKLDAALQLYEAKEQEVNDRLVSLAQRCAKDLQEYQHRLYRLVSDFYRSTAEVILPTPAGSSKEFLRRATEKIAATPLQTAPSSRASMYPLDESPPYPPSAPAPRLAPQNNFAHARDPSPAPHPPSYPSKLSTAPPDILILDDSPATRSAPSPGPRGGYPPAARASPASSYKGSAASSSLPASRASLPLTSSLGSKDPRPQSMLGRSKAPPALAIPAATAAAAAATAAAATQQQYGNGPPSPASSTDNLQPAPRLHAQTAASPFAAHPAPAHFPGPPAATDYPPIQHPPSTRSSPANSSPLQPASPATANHLQPQPPYLSATASARAAPPGSNASRGGSDAGSSAPPSDAELMQQQARVTQLMHAAHAKEAAGDHQSAQLLHSHAVNEAQSLRHNMALRNAAAAAAAAGGGGGADSDASGPTLSARPTARDADAMQAARQQQQAVHAAAVAAAVQQQQAAQAAQQMAPQSAMASAPAALGGGAGAAGDGAGADLQLAAQRQRVHALMQASHAKRQQGDAATANKLHTAAMQQAMLLKAAVDQRQQAQVHAAHAAAGGGGGTPRGSAGGNDSDAVPDVADAAARQREAAMLMQQQQAHARAVMAAQQQHAAAAAAAAAAAKQQQQQAAGQQHPHAAAIYAAAAAAGARPAVPGMHMPQYDDEEDDDELDDESDGSDWGADPGGAGGYHYPPVHQGPDGGAMDSLPPPGAQPQGLQWA